MKKLRKSIGLCLILAVIGCAVISAPAYAGFGPQGQTVTDPKTVAPAPRPPSSSTVSPELIAWIMAILSSIGSW
jgi:hypothetical protein